MLTIVRPGLFSSVQDGGRAGVQALGVTPGGAVDDVALRLGNAIVGNPWGSAAIEMTLQGAEIHFSQDTLIALTGAPLLMQGKPAPMWRPMWVRSGVTLKLGAMTQGVRTYLCAQGGIITPKVLGGHGADVRNGFGGGVGRALVAEDTVSLAPQEARYNSLYRQLRMGHKDFATTSWQVSIWRDWLPVPHHALRLVPATAMRQLSEASRQRIFNEDFSVSPVSDRQGLRLEGVCIPDALPRQTSAGVCFGLAQLPPDGHPIILLADHQTTGGYPVLGVVASVDRTCLAQARPGDKLRFQPLGLGDAHATLWAREQRLQTIERMLRWQMQQ